MIANRSQSLEFPPSTQILSLRSKSTNTMMIINMVLRAVFISQRYKQGNANYRSSIIKRRRGVQRGLPVGVTSPEAPSDQRERGLHWLLGKKADATLLKTGTEKKLFSLSAHG